MALLEAQFPDHKPLMPPTGTPERARADSLMRLERRFFSDWLAWLCRSAPRDVSSFRWFGLVFLVHVPVLLSSYLNVLRSVEHLAGQHTACKLIVRTCFYLCVFLAVRVFHLHPSSPVRLWVTVL